MGEQVSELVSGCVRVTVLSKLTHVQYISIGLALVRVFELSVADEDGVHVGAGILVQLLVVGDHDDCYLTVTKNAEFICLLQQACLTLAERDLWKGRNSPKVLVQHVCICMHTCTLEV